MPLKKVFPLLLCLISIFSCVDSLDFTQVEDYKATPEYTIALTYFTILPVHFFNELGVQQTEITDITDFRIFENSYLQKNLIKIDFNVEVKNEFDRDFTIQVDFLNDQNFPIHEFEEMEIEANTIDYKFLETVEVSTNPNIKNVTRVRVNIRIDNSTTPLNISGTSEFDFKSSAKIYIETGD